MQNSDNIPKILIQLLIAVTCVVATWFGLKQINWMNLLHINQAKLKIEEKAGDLIWESIKLNEDEVENSYAYQTIDSIVNKICVSNGIEKNKIKVHLVESSTVNAFTLPNYHLVIYTGLIEESNNAEELAGVIAHEIGHMELNHVMRKMIKEVGLSVIASMTSGGNGQTAKQLAKILSSTAYDRAYEKEADLAGCDYLIKAKINPEGLANFLYRMDKTNSLTSNFSWLMTHPDSKTRANYILEYIKSKSTSYKSPIQPTTFTQLKDTLN